MMKPVILCVDDEHIVLNSLVDQLLHILGDTYQIEVAENAEEALDVLEDLRRQQVEVPVIISDQLMPGMKGDELLSRIHRRYPQALKIFLTGQADALAVGNAVNRANLYRYIAKPWDETDLKLTVTEAVYRYEQEKQLEAQRRLRDEALIQERLAKEALRQANEALELRVQERTVALAQVNNQLREELEERKRIEAELRCAQDRADAASQAKNAFLSNMSHELRTPLNAIMGFAQLLLHNPNLTPEQHEHLLIINRSGDHLLMLINHLIELSRIKADAMDWEEAFSTDFAGMTVHPDSSSWLTPNDLAALPQSVRHDLKQAIEAINVELVNILLDRIRANHGSIVTALDELVKNYRFDTLQTLFE